MIVERWLRAIGGSFIIGSVLLARYHSACRLFFTAFVGVEQMLDYHAYKRSLTQAPPATSTGT